MDYASLVEQLENGGHHLDEGSKKFQIVSKLVVKVRMINEVDSLALVEFSFDVKKVLVHGFSCT